MTFIVHGFSFAWFVTLGVPNELKKCGALTGTLVYQTLVLSGIAARTSGLAYM
jgi:hypothetical protein